MSPCLEVVLPQTLPEEGALPQSRGLEGTPTPVACFPPMPALFLPEGKTGWTLGPPPPARPHAQDTAAERLRLCVVTEPLRTGLPLRYGCKWLEPRSRPNSVSSPWPHGPAYSST